MEKLKTGQIMPDFEFETPFSAGHKLSEAAAGAKKTALVFLRYWGCTLCQYDIHLLAQSYDAIRAGGGQMFVVLQSDPGRLAGELKTADALPFEIICDPDQKLYRAFGIEAAPSMAKMADLKMLGKAMKATKLGFRHGEYEGEEKQLPAAFVVDSGCKILYAHYAKSISDMPDAAELEKLLA